MTLLEGINESDVETMEDEEELESLLETDDTASRELNDTIGTLEVNAIELSADETTSDELEKVLVLEASDVALDKLEYENELKLELHDS